MTITSRVVAVLFALSLGGAGVAEAGRSKTHHSTKAHATKHASSHKASHHVAHAASHKSGSSKNTKK